MTPCILQQHSMAKCWSCGSRCHLECEACFAIMSYNGEEHGCPDGCLKSKTPFCSECESFTVKFIRKPTLPVGDGEKQQQEQRRQQHHQQQDQQCEKQQEQQQQQQERSVIFQCSKCHYVFFNWRNLLHHLRTWHTCEYFSNQCICCEETFLDRRTFLNHLRHMLGRKL